jgi:multidrug transporter EmrE-like cation transporter
MLGALLGMWLLREPLSLARLGGTALILAGVVLLAQAG